MTALILCGGQGLRLKGIFKDTPKPLVPVAGQPLVAHIIDRYHHFGVCDFVLLVGHSEDAFVHFAREYERPGVRIRVAQTGADTPTGGRLSQAVALVNASEPVLATYGDCLADVDVDALIAQHRNAGNEVTLTAVRPRLPFGLLALADNDRIQSFQEKPVLDQWTNGGFFVLSPEVLERIAPDSDFERDVLPGLAAKGKLGAYRHQGFWRSVDTYKDYLEVQSDDLS